MTLEKLFTLEKLNNAFYQSSKISYWKDSTQRYKSNLLINNLKLQEELINNSYMVSKPNKFTINERGKTRLIEAPSQRDRIVQKILCNEILIPQLTKYLIYDNYASLKNRGTSFARKRVEIMLRKYISTYGDIGYVLKIDIKKYFESIDHEILKQMVRCKVNASNEVLNLIDYIIDTSSNSDKGLNLGSEAPQILAIYYLSKIDNYIKTVLGIKYYGRYMDDMIIISNDKKELEEILSLIKVQLSNLKLEVNEKKTNITKLTQGFTYLQIKYLISNNKIIKRPTRDKITRERRRLKKYKILYDKGLMSISDINNCYKSWRNNMIKECNCCWKSINNLDNLFKSLFPNIEYNKKIKRNELINSIFINEFK